MITDQVNAIATTMAELIAPEGFTAPLTVERIVNGECVQVIRYANRQQDEWHPSPTTPTVIPQELLIYDADGHFARFLLFGGHCERCE